MSELSHDPFYFYKTELDDQQVIDVLVDAIMNDEITWGDSHIDKVSRRWSNPVAFDEYLELSKRYHQGVCHYFLSVHYYEDDQYIEGFCLSDSDVGPYAVDENGDESMVELEDIRDISAIVREHLENAPLNTESIIDKAKIQAAFLRVVTSYALSGSEDEIYAATRLPDEDQYETLEKIANDIYNRDYGLNQYTIRNAVTDLAYSKQPPKNQL